MSVQSENDHSTSASLLDRLRKETACGWDRLSELYAPMVYRWTQQTGLPPAARADVTQEVFRVVKSNLQFYRPTGSRGSFRSWLWGITRDALRHHMESASERPGTSVGPTGGPLIAGVSDLILSDEPPPIASEQNRLMHRALSAIREDFEDKTWQAFWRTTIDHRSPDDVGSDLEMTSADVRQAKYLVLSRLRDELVG